MANLSAEATPAHPILAEDLPSPTVVRSFGPALAERWDSFVLGQPRGSFFHLIGWMRVIAKTFGFEPRYVYAERAGQITGVVPLFAVSNWVVGRVLLSVPLGVYGGICAADTESERMLLDHVKQMAIAEQADYLELRRRDGGIFEGFHRNPRYVTFTAPLLPEPEANIRRLPRDTRYMIRKAEKAGLRARSGTDQMEAFYRLFAMSMRRLGTPVFPRELFENLAAEFPGSTDLSLIYAGDEAVSGVLSFHFRDVILPYYSGASPKAQPLAANNFMYAELMKSAAAAGFHTFDFGRSKKGTGAYAFKTQWNMTIAELDYQVYLVRRKTVPNFSPANPTFERATRAWKRLPLWMATWVGPRIVRWFP
jgi:FemAB-related protein (PEP-CTERM system-associated)